MPHRTPAQPNAGTTGSTAPVTVAMRTLGDWRESHNDDRNKTEQNVHATIP
jgi:hypothetical protein